MIHVFSGLIGTVQPVQDVTESDHQVQHNNGKNYSSHNIFNL